MESRGGEPRGRKTGTVSQGAIMRKQGGEGRGGIDATEGGR